MKNKASYTVVSEWLNEYKIYIKNHHRPTFSWVPIIIILVVLTICFVIGPVLIFIFFKNSWISEIYYAMAILGLIVYSLFENAIISNIKKVDLNIYKNYCEEMYKSFSLIQKKDAQYIKHIINRAQTDLYKKTEQFKEKQIEKANLFCIIVIGTIIAIAPQFLGEAPSAGKCVLTFICTVFCCRAFLMIKDFGSLFIDVIENREIRLLHFFITDLQYIVDTHFSFSETLKDNSRPLRPSGQGCPVCAEKNRRITRRKTEVGLKGSLSELMPELAAEWHTTKNRDFSPANMSRVYSKKVWWVCPDGGYEYQARVSYRNGNARHQTGCPICKKQS